MPPPPILDKQVADWLQMHADTTLQIDRTSTYERYLKLPTGWGKQHDQPPSRSRKPSSASRPARLEPANLFTPRSGPNLSTAVQNG